MLPTFSEQLAADRRATFLAEADSSRLVRQGRGLRHATASRRPSLLGRVVMRVRRLGVRIRPIRPADAQMLEDGFNRLSDRSRQLRFLAPKNHLSRAELRY